MEEEISLERKNTIPIFFATDDNYIPFLDVAIRSLIHNASKNYVYDIIILNSGINQDNKTAIESYSDNNFRVRFFDVSEKLDDVKDKLRNVFHFGLATYYRLFIESLFPEYDKVLYIDCDLVVTGDISKLYEVDLEDNFIAGAIEQYMNHTPEFSIYTDKALGINAKNYINAGVLVLSLSKFRENHIQDKFVELLNKYNFESIAPDQDYLNFLCKGKIKYLPESWNRTPIEIDCDNDLNIVHYALYKKPWQYDDVMFGEYFWNYAKDSQFYEKILEIKNGFNSEMKEKKEKANVDIKRLALKIADSNVTFYKKLVMGV